MITFTAIILSLFSGLLLLIAIFFLFFAVDSIVRRHDLPTSSRAAKVLIRIIEEYKPDARIFFDLGCGRGTLALAVKKGLPHLCVHGIDNSTVRIFFARLKAWGLGQKMIFKKGDIFQMDAGDANVLYTYLWYDTMPPLEEKLRRELKSGTLVVTNTSKFPDWKPVAARVVHPGKPDFEKLFVYVV